MSSQSYNSIARAHLQHFLFKQQLGYLINPTITLPSSDVKIADIGCGTGIWLLDLASTLPPSSSLDGFDIDLSGCPHPKWRPNNVRFHKWDVYEKVPEEFLGRYDFVNIRSFVFHVKGNDSGVVLKNAVRMLKPGGWLQWVETDLCSCAILSATPETPTTNSQALYDLTRSLIPQLQPDNLTWLGELPESFKSAGLSDVQSTREGGHEWLLGAEQDVALMGMEEIIKRMPGDLAGKVQGVTDLAAKEFQESGRGVASGYKKLVVIGRKE